MNGLTDTKTLTKIMELIQLIEKEIAEEDKSIPIKNVEKLVKILRKIYREP